MLQVLKKIFGDKAERDIKAIKPLVVKANEIFETLKDISNDELRARTNHFINQIVEETSATRNQIESIREEIKGLTDFHAKEALYEKIDKLEEELNKEIEVVLEAILPDAFATVKETARRFANNDEVEVKASDRDRELATEHGHIRIDGDKAYWRTQWEAGGNEIKWDMIHYDVQLIGGVALHQGKIAEMQTGEGKTLVATLPVYLNALAKRGVHVVTVNDYLATRDSRWMGPLYEFHGLSVDCIDNHQPNSERRRAAYRADITFGTNNEFGFDYLRDNMATSPEDLVQRKHHYAIVDEVDSVLIDEARTPLIISGPTPGGDKHEFDELKPRVEKLMQNQKKVVTQTLADAKRLLAGLADGTVSKEDQDEGGKLLLRAHRGLPKSKALIKFLSEPGIKTHLQKMENLFMQDHSKRMPEVDEVLFFTIEEKNNQVDLTEQGIGLISGDVGAEFFIMPDISTELSAIENSEQDPQAILAQKDALLEDYNVKTERIHSMNQLLKAYALFEKDTEYVVMNNKVMIVDEQTGRIMDGRRYSDGLHQAIEAKESVKIEASTQTYASVTLQNYFRMYHKLSGMTGTAETEAGEFWDIYKLDVVVIPTNRPIQRKDQEDKVYKTVREKFNAVIEEIARVREEGRPTLVGTTSVEISELLSRMLKQRGIPHNVLNAKYHEKEAEIVQQAGQAGMITIATNMAGRGTDIKLSPEVKERGGLVIIGTERHDSRRVDRQLRGRSGRQGDPGESQFYVSLEDNLMRIFGSERISKLMDRMGLKEGEVIQHSMISKSIERAQKKVEENNFGIRKRLLEYDNVMNSQREVVYKRRKNALLGERLGVDIAEMFVDIADDIAQNAARAKDHEVLKYEFKKAFGFETKIGVEEFTGAGEIMLSDAIIKEVLGLYNQKKEAIAAQIWPVVKQVHEGNNGQFKNIALPFTDGEKGLQINANLQEAYDTQAKSIYNVLEKNVILSHIDQAWQRHLKQMDDLRSSVQNAVHEQKDPLLIYKFESFEIFKNMIHDISKDVVNFLVRAGIPMQENPEKEIKATNAETIRSRQTKMVENKDEVGNLASASQANQQAVAQSAPQREPQAPAVKEDTIGRNDPCPCGSGKKYKKCHGA